MHVLVDGRWQGGFLDYSRGAAEYRVDVHAWYTLEALTGMYFIREPNVRRFLGYVREVGVRTSARKVLSRRAERARNAKVLACGYGTVGEAPLNAAALEAGTSVVFVATQHPECVERLVVPGALLTVVPKLELPHFEAGVRYERRAGAPPPELHFLRGWSAHAGIAIDKAKAATALRTARRLVTEVDWSNSSVLPLAAPSRPRESSPPSHARRDPRRPAAVLLGYGNYAKTHLLPHVREEVDVRCVHELDPMQIPQPPPLGNGWDTAPSVRRGERYDVHFIAGYHASHAGLAVQALAQGAAAVVEKPLATRPEQLDQLVAALGQGGRYFACFQRRFTPLNELALQDLQTAPGEPVNYHCVVYEEPLPELHWYRWPSSGSRLLSNGCHWIDHFLWLNGFSDVTAMEVWRTREVLNCSLELRNGAAFTMVLTDEGSARVGMQDHAELRANGRTVTIRNLSIYEAQGPTRVLRRKRVPKAGAYARMYCEIARRLALRDPGDSIESVARSAGTVLSMEAMVPTSSGPIGRDARGRFGTVPAR